LIAGIALPSKAFTRPAAVILSATLVPATLGGHRFWEATGEQREQQINHFLKNLAILGGSHWPLVSNANASQARSDLPH
jgi:putative oxidoreductase